MVVLYFISAVWARIIIWTLLSPKALVLGQTDQYKTLQQADFTYKELTTSIIKSDNDKREYKGLELSNGLQVILISDPDVSQAAVALDVKVGSYSDPKNLFGLAHLCEHLLFTGNEKYPIMNEIKKYTKSNSGIVNASTSFEDTSYYFHINNNALDGGLDRFAQLFINPTMKHENVEQEVNNINSEYENNLLNNEFRVDQVKKFLSNPNHPYSYFATGNYETLISTPKSQGIDIWSELLKFYQTHYSGKLMKLVVIGKDSIENLKKLVVPNFSQIPNYQTEVPKFEGSPFTESQVGIQINAVPIGDEKTLEMEFLLPSQVNYFNEKPTLYVSHFLGDQGTGSILALLKKIGWILSISSGVTEDAASFSLFKIIFELTSEGLKHTHIILKLTFSYIRLLREQGVTEARFKEIQTIAASKFKFGKKPASIDYAIFLAGLMHSPAPLSQVLSSNSLVNNFNVTLIQNTLKLLSPRRVRVTLVEPSVEKMVNLKKEPLTGTQFSVENLPEPLLEELETIKLDSNLKLPSIVGLDPTNFKALSQFDYNKRPQLVSNVTGSLLWHINAQFDNSNTSIRLIIKNNQLFKSPLEVVKLSMFKEMVMEELISTDYLSSFPGLKYRVTVTHPGIVVTVEGYNENFLGILIAILEKMKSLKVTSQLFNHCQNKTKSLQKNFKVNQPSVYIKYFLQTALSENRWSVDQLSFAAPKITLKDMQEFSDKVLNQGKLEMMAVGNIDAETLQIFFKQVQNILTLDTVLFNQSQSQRVVNLNESSVYQASLFGSQNTNSTIGVYTDLYGYSDGLQKAAVQLLGQLISGPASYSLRTKKTFGYNFNSGVFDLNPRGGILISVQSDEAPLFIVSRIENIFQTFQGYLGNLTMEEVHSESKSLQQSIQSKQRNLTEFADFYWNSIVTGYYDFDKELKMIENLKNVTPQILKELGKQLVAPKYKRHQLFIHLHSQQYPLISKLELQSKVGELIEDLIEWRSKQNLSPYPQPNFKINNLKCVTRSTK